ncbi:MAG: RNA polymerase sigma factor [Thermoanaerobaculia bacterium]
MSDPGRTLEETFRRESGRMLSTLIGLLGDFDLAEEALQEAASVALTVWRRDGAPQNPRAWLIATARNRAIDRLRRDANLARKLSGLAPGIESTVTAPELPPDSPLEATDDRLRLLFTCCHPALAAEAQIALALRTLCGLSTEEIARAFLTPVPTMQQRLVRAKSKIRDARIPYRVPEGESEIEQRLDAVLQVIYLVFNEGYKASAGSDLVRVDLCHEAIRLGRLLTALLPGRPEAIGLLALMLLQDSRRSARFDGRGDLIRLAEQDRSLWDRDAIREGLALVEEALRLAKRPRPFALQAAIASVHARAATAAETEWREIVGLYDLLLAVEPSPVVALNRAVALAATADEEGEAPLHAALAEIERLRRDGRLAAYYLLPAVEGDLLLRLGRRDDARRAFAEALELVATEPERRFLAGRLADC